ncbi:MAG: SRPBCC family protein [Oleiphilaceae bacterium]|nr:SRPBCC family protein [Oleiphilaceae bacterium]
MTVKVSIDLDKEFTVKADIDTAFALLADVPASASHFPKVDNLSDLGDNTFKWEMEKVGLGDHAIQTIYACQYHPDESNKTIRWTPIKGEGNGVVSGGWKLTEDGAGTKIKFETSAELTLPLPGLLKLAISPVVKHEFAAMVDTYIDNLKGALS